MSPATAALPAYLKKYAAEQHYDKYTSQDHAAWRYIMRQNRAFFSKHAVPIYADGLKKTGIPVDRIPRISEMDECLARFGWGAVPVVGFIPPAAFLEFQARGVLPIATDMRTVGHIAYTPAPDIVHEAAGHAPIIAEPSYAQYLHRYAQMAQKAIQSLEDIRVYEAIRYLSDIKENPDTTPARIAEAEARLKATGEAVSFTSEATKVARMAWWTVEYGLVGPPSSPRIYGAGLLSSVGESQACLSDKVRKIPLSVDCVHQSYDITEPQPQLFVTPDLDYLHVVLGDLEKTLSFVVGGVKGLEEAERAETVNTVTLDSGLQISGKLVEFEGEEFVKFSGPVQLSLGDRQLRGHGRERHGEGFSTPLGRWEIARDRAPSDIDDKTLAAAGLRPGARAELRFVNGFVVKGEIVAIHREGGKLLYVTWRDCTATRGRRTYFEPSWGEFDMAVGERVPSVSGGPADRAAYGELDIGQATTTPGRTTPFSAEELRKFDLYARIRAARRATGPELEVALESLARDITAQGGDEWLLSLELIELVEQRLKQSPATLPWARTIEESLHARLKRADETTATLIRNGLALVSLPD